MATWNIEVPQSEYYGPLPFNPRGVVSGNLEALIRELEDWRTQVIAIDTETTGLVVYKDMVLYWSLAWGNRRCTLHASLLPLFRHIFEDPNKIWIFANAKYDLHMLANMGILIRGKKWCSQVMHSLLFEETSHRLKDMAKHLLGWRWSDFQDTFGRINEKNPPAALMQKAEQQNFPLLVEYAANDSWGTLGCAMDLIPRLQSAQTHSLFRECHPYIETLWDLFSKVEAPYTQVLWENERNGILVNQQYLADIGPQARREIQEIEMDICRLAGRLLNPGSSHELRDFFINHCGLRPKKMTKGGQSGNRQASIDADFLEYASGLDGLPGMVAKRVLDFRSADKLNGTYIEGIAEYLDAHGRIHTRFNQDVTRTGRLSCVAEWTPIETARGVWPIKSVRVGDLVLTHQDRWRRVLKTVTKGLGHMFDVHLSNGNVLSCTADHRLLSSNGQWVPVGDLIDEYLERVGVTAEKPGASAEALSVLGLADDRADCGETGDDVPQRLSRDSLADAGEGAEDSGKAALLSVEDGEQEPHERKYGQRSPQLEGRVRRWQRLLDHAAQRQKAVRSSSSDGQGVGPERAAGDNAGSSHRRRSEEQQLGQPRSSYPGRAQDHSLFAGRGLPAVEITEVHYRGRLEVHDITVEEDESYLACGVLSHNSADPNLQNIPTEENDKWRLRAAFIAPPGYDLIVADYSQLEMRLLAAAAREMDMVNIFLSGWDIHMGNAAMMKKIPYEEIKDAKKIDGLVKAGKLDHAYMTQRVLQCLAARAQAKNIGFGLNYGMGAGKLANDLGISRAEAESLIALYKRTYPAVTKFYDEAVAMTRKYGYSFTILGRRRNLPNILSPRNDERARAERQAINVEIQGSAADVVKMAQIHLHRSRLDYKYGCRALLNIHDELVFECPKETSKQCMEEIKDWMEHPFHFDLDVPLTISAGIASNWADAK